MGPAARHDAKGITMGKIALLRGLGRNRRHRSAPYRGSRRTAPCAKGMIVVVAGGVALALLAFGVGPAAASEPRTWVVDRDGVECGNAEFTSIQAAVDAAQPGDLIRVCPDLYTETVVVDKPLTLKADADAIAAFDCLQPTLGELSVDQQAI